MWQDIDFSKLSALLLNYDEKNQLIFSSGLFLFLFLAFSCVYALLRKAHTARLLFVTAFSYYFYYKSSGTYFQILAIVTCFDFVMAHGIYSSGKKWQRLLFVWLSVIVDMSFLVYFKYTNFFGTIWADITGGHFETLDIVLPVGISFFTFQSLSYTIDVYRGKLKPLDSLLDYAFFVSFFPQLVAGPIVRASDFIPQIHRKMIVTRETFGEGLFLIVAGLFKKAVICDYISVNFVQRIFDNPSLYSGLENLLGIYGFALQIYCDFSGYSDMAIGIALLLGFNFPQNFNSPYKSASVAEFWHRWHISLSSWLRDYVYISLGGNRKGKFMTYVNLILTMLVGGLWHGASWNFVAWGAMHGFALAAHRLWNNIMGFGKNHRYGWFLHAVCVVVTFHFVCLGWVFFRNTSFDNSLTMLGLIFSNFKPQIFWQLVQGYWGVMSLMLLGYLLHFVPDSWVERSQGAVIKMPLVAQALLVVVVIYIVIQIKSSDVQPFIYFQF